MMERIDPIGACVGMRGARVQAVSNELGENGLVLSSGMKSCQFVINAMAPARSPGSITVDEQNHSMEIVGTEGHLSQAIGLNGQNIRLAGQLTMVLN